MAMQDDIMALLSQVSTAGDRATARQDRGIELYENIGSLIGDSPNYRKALRELTGLGSREDMTLEEEMRNDPGLSDRVASIIEKYMADAATIGQVPADMIVDDTREAERMLETAGMAPREAVSIEELPAAAPRQAVTREPLPPTPDFDPETAERLILERDEGLAGLLAGQEAPEAGMLVGTSPSTPIQTGGDYGEFAGTPRTSVAPARVADGRIPLKERLFAGQEAAGGPMSGSEQLMFASSFVPLAMLPAVAAKVGIGAAQVARFLRAGKKGEQALREVIKKREYARDARGRFVSPNQGVPNPTPGARMTERATPGKGPGLNMGESQLRDMGLFGRLAGGAAGGGSVGNIRDGIMRNYAMMADGGSTTEEMDGYDENPVQQMRRLKKELGTKEAVKIMRELHPEYTIRDSGMILPKAGPNARYDSDRLPVENAPLELLRNYLRNRDK